MIPAVKQSPITGDRWLAEAMLSLMAARSNDRFALDAPGEAAAADILDDTRAQLVPIVVVVANGAERDRIVRELTVQLDALLVRAQTPAPDGTREIDGLHIDRDGHRVIVGGEEISLTHIEFKLLVTLADRKDRVQSRQTLLTDVWGLNPQNKTRTVDTHIKRLRGKLGGAARFIQSVRGVGYRFGDGPSARRFYVRADRQEHEGQAGVVAA